MSILLATQLCIGAYANILVWPGIAEASTYGKTNWITMSAMLDASSGNTMQVVSNFSDTAQVMASDALWIGLGPRAAALSSTEVLNIQNFVATGRRVVLMGENWLWGGWNNQITGLLGGSFGGDDFNGNTVPITNSELTDGVSLVYVPTGGVPLGGIPLFDGGHSSIFGPSNFASLYGPSTNALVLLDVNSFADDFIGRVDNGVFAQHVANWIAVPEPGTVGLMGIGSGILLFSRRHRRRKHTPEIALKNTRCQCDTYEPPQEISEPKTHPLNFWDLLIEFDRVKGAVKANCKAQALHRLDAFLARIMK